MYHVGSLSKVLFSSLDREAWSQCGNASKEECMRMYIEELQRVS